MQWDMPFGDLDGTTLLLGLSFVLGFVYFITSRTPKKFPPGPSGLPIVGYVPFVGENAASTFLKMRPKYGSVMSVQMGLKNWVILNDYDALNEALVKQGEKFSGRPSDFILQFIAKGNGILGSDYGIVWKTLRKFGLMTLRGFGVGKKSMEENVAEETPYLLNTLLKADETVRAKVTLAVSNIICRVVFGSRFEYDNKRFLELTGLVDNLFSDEKIATKLSVVAMAPIVRFVPPFRGAFKTLMKSLKRIVAILRDIIEEHRKTFDENDLRDVIDAFLKEMKTNGKENGTFCEDQLIQFIRDLFVAGTGTTTTILSWAMLCFINYPEYQEKIAEEARSVLGEDGIPTMKHRDEMPFTCAFIQELMRHRTLTPIGPLHKTNAVATIGRYVIPKDTTIGPSIWSVHMDPKYFENPTEFRPERFLDKDGKFVKSTHVIPFSIGPRHCLGEQLARMEIFIFLAGICQKLRVIPDSANPPQVFEDNTVKILGLLPPPFHAKFELR